MNFSITRRGDYGLVAVLYLARQPEGSLAQIHEIAASCSLPEPFLAQILRLLVHAGIVNSKKGVGGGFSLLRKPESISFLEVLEALEGHVAVNRCQDLLAPCEHTGSCSMEFVWIEAQEALVSVLRKAKIGDALCSGCFPFAGSGNAEGAAAKTKPVSPAS